METLETIKNLTMTQWSFYAVSVLTLFGALGTILSKNPIHSVIYLIMTFFSLSAHYVLLNAQFLAAVNIVVYAGAIMVLFLFVVMFLNIKDEAPELDNNKIVIGASIVGGTIGVILVAAIRLTESQKIDPSTYQIKTGFIETLGQLLYSKYLLPFELVSVLFLIAMSGAVMLGRKEKGERNF
ncbi:NADH-quinone oxidoreductase subunit J family protein [Jiulongibacter sediminis]|uniref:NADH-quinone oxidoreductase subunit J n=1 Tax=Jiulongibacter sediminis TaxID=1605367 RepID=A0A0P7C0S3_9BACT|nr:NADH-quinone oxidoreductase subunit J [Jiulongibacter sediminis]KPM46873.1 NADH dehydrogenase [Jiulongibacter sediminis]TBX22223.1 NADH dehydrogenase [Jiulongibacter sediminis]